MKTERRESLKKMFASLLGVIGLGLAVKAKPFSTEEKVVNDITTFQDVPLFASSTKFGNLVFIAGKGGKANGANNAAPFEIKADTDVALKKLEDALIKAGSSMEKVLRVTVYLIDMADYAGMNSVYKGRFGKNPPVRTCISVAKDGIPDGSKVEIECIAFI